jgi:hypothetical protein
MVGTDAAEEPSRREVSSSGDLLPAASCSSPPPLLRPAGCSAPPLAALLQPARWLGMARLQVGARDPPRHGVSWEYHQEWGIPKGTGLSRSSPSTPVRSFPPKKRRFLPGCPVAFFYRTPVRIA